MKFRIKKKPDPKSVSNAGGYMEVGDLVRDIHDEDLGVIIGFDHEDDPNILWQSDGQQESQYRRHVEVISETR
jgi:acyl-CoA hydrolase